MHHPEALAHHATRLLLMDPEVSSEFVDGSKLMALLIRTLPPSWPLPIPDEDETEEEHIDRLRVGIISTWIRGQLIEGGLTGDLLITFNTVLGYVERNKDDQIFVVAWENTYPWGVYNDIPIIAKPF